MTYRNLGGAILIEPAGTLAVREAEFFFANVVTGTHEYAAPPSLSTQTAWSNVTVVDDRSSIRMLKEVSCSVTAQFFEAAALTAAAPISKTLISPCVSAGSSESGLSLTGTI